MDLMRPDIAKERPRQAIQVTHPASRRLSHAKNYREGPQWMPGLVVDRKGPLSYVIQLESGLMWRRHIDQLQLEPDRVVQGGSGTGGN